MRRRRSPSPSAKGGGGAGGGSGQSGLAAATASALRPLRTRKKLYSQFPTALWLRPLARRAAAHGSVLIRRGGGRQRVGGGDDDDGFVVLWEWGQRVPTVVDGGAEVRPQQVVHDFVPERASDEECAQLRYWEAGGMWVERMRGCGGGGGGDDDDDDDPIFLDESGCPVVVRTAAELQTDEERCAVEVAEAVGVAARSGPEWDQVKRVLERTEYRLSEAADLYFQEAHASALQASDAAPGAPRTLLPAAPETPLFASPVPVAKRVRRQAADTTAEAAEAAAAAAARPEVALYQKRFQAHVECLKAAAAASSAEGKEEEARLLRKRVWQAREARADAFLILHFLAGALGGGGGGGGGVGWTQLLKAFCVVPVEAEEKEEEEGRDEWAMRRSNVLLVQGPKIFLHLKVADGGTLCVSSTHSRPGCAGGAAGDAHTVFCQCGRCPQAPVSGVAFLEGSLQAALGLGSLRNVVTFLLCAAVVVGSKRGGEAEAMPKPGCLTALRERLCAQLSG